MRDKTLQAERTEQERSYTAQHLILGIHTIWGGQHVSRDLWNLRCGDKTIG